MNCKSCVNLLLEYQDGCLESDLRAEFEEHLKACAKCRALTRTYCLTINLSAKMRPASSLTPEMAERLKNLVIDRFSTGKH
ncbi:MAG: hypothetical protein BWY87_00089 [Deltaproteobacteria bacterium ADurb.Bin510]|nr:MAG: hypothetical protein BWY87_00089 [Deltaproteobacteria bacterium ADurb.Bin510]